MAQEQLIKVIYSRGFLKQHALCPGKIRLQFEHRLDILLANSNDPRLHIHPLKGRYHHYQSMNVTGDWRAVFRKITRDTVYFVAIGTHSQLYR